MQIIRNNKIKKLLQQKIDEIFRCETSKKLRLISVSQVYISSDLELAKIYLSIFLVKNKKKILLEINKKSKYYKNILAKRIRNQIRKTPNLKFFLDDYLDNLEKINYELYKKRENLIKI